MKNMTIPSDPAPPIAVKAIHLCVATLSCASFFGATASAQNLGSVHFGPPAYPTDGNLGTTLVLFSGELTVTARSIISNDDSQKFVLNAAGQTGTIYLDSNSNTYLGGLGVQNAAAAGSNGISGGGPNGNEELIFSYATGVYLGTASIIINELEYGNGVDDKDDPYLWIDTSAGLFSVNEATLLSASTFGIGADAAKSATVSFASMATALSINPNVTLNSFTLRETRDHIFVNGLNGGTLIPEPSSMSLIALTAFGLAVRRRR